MYTNHGARSAPCNDSYLAQSRRYAENTKENVFVMYLSFLCASALLRDAVVQAVDAVHSTIIATEDTERFTFK